ncbi:protein obstructor-E-like [Armigeres subalbatus]|uniref:protein obstructor-E-like n=1 Tax=Armigeres subalbatus TaxID=124917 RepID=UPI002ED0DF3C
MRCLTIQALIVACAIAYCSCQSFDPTVCLQLPDDSKIASPNVCNEFFVCEGGMLSEGGYCPANMLFNPVTQDCDFANNVDCQGVPLPPGFETDEPIETTEATESTGSTGSTELTQQPETTEPTTEPRKCPSEDNEDPLYLPVHNDCSSYILCYHGKEIPLSCPANLYWNEKTTECDSSSIANCKQSDKFGCPSVGIDFLPHPESCRKFIYCRDGYSREQSCGFFKVFNKDLKTCELGDSC